MTTKPPKGFPSFPKTPDSDSAEDYPELTYEQVNNLPDPLGDDDGEATAETAES